MGPERRLGRRARSLFARAERGEASIYVSVITLVEVAEVVRRSVIRCDLHDSGAGGRLIAATAVHLESPLITADPAIGRVPGVVTVW